MHECMSHGPTLRCTVSSFGVSSPFPIDNSGPRDQHEFSGKGSPHNVPMQVLPSSYTSVNACPSYPPSHGPFYAGSLSNGQGPAGHPVIQVPKWQAQIDQMINGIHICMPLIQLQTVLRLA